LLIDISYCVITHLYGYWLTLILAEGSQMNHNDLNTMALGGGY
jgi:hypothetical protein